MDTFFELLCRARLGELTAELEMMKMANAMREALSQAPAYGEEGFDAVVAKFSALQTQIKEHG